MRKLLESILKIVQILLIATDNIQKRSITVNFQKYSLENDGEADQRKKNETCAIRIRIFEFDNLYW